MEHLYPYPKMGTSFLEILHDALTRKLLGFDAVHAEPTPFIGGVTSRLKFLLNDATQQLSFLKIGYTALEAFLQANCTGPPLDFNTEDVIFPETYRQGNLNALKEELSGYLSIDGSRPYPLTPHIELFWLAKVVLSHPALAEAGFNGRRARFRLNSWHQRLLSEQSPTLRDIIYADADVLEQQLSSRLAFGGAAAEEHFVEFLVERAVARTYYGDDSLARTDLARAATTRQFQFVLSGALGKRTKFQDKNVSQLVVLAKSRDFEPEPYSSRKNSRVEGSETPKGDATSGLSSTPRRPSTPAKSNVAQHEPTSPLAKPPTQPENLLLNDDTLLERISFNTNATEPQSHVSEQTMTQITSSSSTIPAQLAALDPANQPLLFPMDSIILLATASSITNTSPDDGLVREETLPYATRVLDGGSSNWQVYTQALLVRSRIEGYKARTAERGLLQLQALVDQVVAETSQSSPPLSTTASQPAESGTSASVVGLTSRGANTFLPRASAAESATVPERLQYIYQISPPLRWELEAELAQRWTSMGGLKTALDIYERLQMYAEVALCLAATDQEGRAVELLKSLLFDDKAGSDGIEAGKERLKSPPPADTPRLLCLLGDITSHHQYYLVSWTASSNHYARAQRSLGRYYTKQRQFTQAAESYRLALNISRLDRASWFSLGCVQLELEDWGVAVESYTRCVQLEDSDAEAWSNLAVALLRLPVPAAPQASKSVEGADPVDPDADGDNQITPTATSSLSTDPLRHKYDALRALRRAAQLKRDDARIWDNYLTVAASIPPSTGQTPWNEIIQAMARIVELRTKREGEGCIDLRILAALTEYITTTWEYPGSEVEEGDGADANKHGSGTDAPAHEAIADASIASESQEHTQSDGNELTPTPTSTAAGAGASSSSSKSTPTKLPHTPRSFLSLIDTQIAPILTASAALSTQLSQVASWRHRPLSSLTYSEKAWRLALMAISPTEQFDDVSAAQWGEVVEKTIWLMARYRELGGLKRERTGGEVESRWRFKAKSAARKVLGRSKTWEDRDEGGGQENWLRLKVAMDEL